MSCPKRKSIRRFDGVLAFKPTDLQRAQLDMRGASDTIFAAATGTACAAISVIRVSGETANEVVCALAGALPPPRRASLRILRDHSGQALDQGLAFWFPAPASYTGEHCAEFHIHGGRATLDAVSRALVEAGARPADPGEFTRRAFLHGKYDLVEAEAISDLITAETDAQRRQALRQLDGELGRLYRGWTARLLDLLARAEAAIDFADEDSSVGEDVIMAEPIEILRREIEEHLYCGEQGERLRNGLVFAVVGAPNVGKSSLVNLLAGQDVAIVAETPGTTRDIIETRVVFGDVPVTLLDTAGLRLTADPIEAEGVRRAGARAENADLVMHVQDASAIEPATPIAPAELVIANKIDVAGKPHWASQAVSAKSGEGLALLRLTLDGIARKMTQSGTSAPLTRARHRAALSDAADRLARAQDASAELRAEDLRLALFALGRVTGQVGVDDILDSIFTKFCIGK